MAGERDRVYAHVVERECAPGFGEYKKRIDRVMPVFELRAD